MARTLEETMARLAALGDEKRRAINAKNGAPENQFGVPMGEIRKLAAEIKSDHALGLALWGTGNVDAQLLGILLIKPKALSRDELDGMVRAGRFGQVADWLGSYVIKHHPDKEALRVAWLEDPDPWAARHGWGLTAERVDKDPAGIDVGALLDRIEREMGTAAPPVQWTMNSCLAAIGIHCPAERARALAIGEELGVYRDYPVSKGCTSPFAPIWIGEMVRRAEVG